MTYVPNKWITYVLTEKSEKYKKQCVSVYIDTYVPWMAIETNFSKICISYSLDKHLNAQLSKWALWLVFVMNTTKIVSYIILISLFLIGRTRKS